MDPTLESLLTVAGNGVLVMVIVSVIKRTLALTAAQVDRFGPLLAIVTGVVVAELAAFTLGQSGRDLATAFLTGIVSGATSQGIYATVGGPMAERLGV